MRIPFPAEILRRNTKTPEGDLRCYPRISAGCAVVISWGAGRERKEVSGNCLDISRGGARIEIADTIPVSTWIRMRFGEFNLEAEGVVRHSDAGALGVEFKRVTVSGPLLPHKPKTILSEVGTPLAIIGALVVIAIATLGFPKIPAGWTPFSSGSSVGPASFNPAHFSVGSTEAEVHAAQGSPTSSTETVWHYGSSRVHFREGRVVGWRSSSSAPLKVGVNTPDSPEARKGHFTVGSSAEEVLAAQGLPAEMEDGVWRYGYSEVFFKDGRVVGWRTSPQAPLKARKTEPKKTPR